MILYLFILRKLSHTSQSGGLAREVFYFWKEPSIFRIINTEIVQCSVLWQIERWNLRIFVLNMRTPLLIGWHWRLGCISDDRFGQVLINQSFNPGDIGWLGVMKWIIQHSNNCSTFYILCEVVRLFHFLRCWLW